MTGRTDGVVQAAFSPDGRRLVSGGEDHTIRLWDAETGVELATLRGHQGSVTSVAFSSDGSILASASADKTIMMWELEETSPAKPADPPEPAKVDRKPVKIPPAPPQEPLLDEPTGPSTGSFRVIRGGCWYDDASHCMASFRWCDVPVSRGGFVGFRVAKTVSSPSR